MQTFLIAVVAAGGLVGAYLSWRWLSVLAHVTRGLEALGEGEKARMVLTESGWPIGRLVDTFNSAASEIQARTARLDQERRELLVVLGAMAEAVIAVDARRRLLFANASANRIFGLDANSVGRLVPELIRSPHVQDAIEATLRLASPRAYAGELMLPNRDPSARSLNRSLSVHGTPLPGQPSPGSVLVFHDVTELRRLERMRQDFVANASHELKNPLASIKAFTESLLDWALHDETVNVRFLERIDEQVDRLDRLVLDLLSLARLESGQAAFEHGPLCLVPMLESCVEAHRERAKTKHLTLTLEAGDIEYETMVLADEEAVRQIVDNLIDNAIKYTPEQGSVGILCSISRAAVRIDVADTGIGIPRDDLPRIFERFYRVDKARSRELGGTGLGLSIVKHLVQSIGGQIEVTSRVGSGSKFTVYLPRQIVAEP
jgi:two-component system, OmpR family, phosphate regulon sensor histidine kinase PhoR